MKNRDTSGAQYAKFGAAFDPGFLRAALIESRARGYSFLDSAATPGTAAVGVAFPPKNPIAAISVAAPVQRMSKKNLQTTVPTVTAAADSISRRLGYLPSLAHVAE